MLFQIRDSSTGRKYLQSDSRRAVIAFLESRNPDLYEIYGMTGVSGMELRFVEPARVFLAGIIKRAEGNNGTAGSF